MAQLLEAPTVGYEDAIVVPEITADNFELKHGLLTLVQNKQFFEHDKEDPHAHIRYFNKITSTMKFPNVPNRLITQPIGIVEDIYVKVEKFQFPADFVVVDFVADLRVPLILGRSFLKTGRAFIDVYEGELTLRVRKEAITFNLDQTLRYSSNYDNNSVNRIDVIEMACEEYSQEVLGFSDVIASGNPTPYYDSIVSTSSPTLTPFGDSNFLLEEVDAFLALEDDPTSPEVDDSYYDPEGDILLLEAFLNDDPSLPLPLKEIICLKFEKNLKFVKQKLTNLQLMNLLRCEDTNLCLNWEKSHFMVKEGIVLGHKISKNRIEVDKAKVDVIAKLPHPTTVKGVRSFLGHAGFYRRFIKDFSKISRPMTHLLEKNTPFIFSDECIQAFETLKKKLTEAPILIAPDWDLPFELMCDASDFAIVDPPRDIMVPTTPPKKFFTQDFIGPQFTEMPMTWSPNEALVSVKEKFRNVMKCHKIPSKFVKSLTFGASISWGRSRLHEETNTYSWMSTTCQNGLKRKRSPPMTPELFANFLNPLT
ncbi:reverse transcriptase domain-containing protein [Tanacetum coccineum]